MERKHVFISYVREDRGRAKKLCKFFKSQGFDVWFDDAIKPGDPWKEEINQAIDEAAAFVIVFSRSTDRRSNGRLGILPELDRAIAYQRQLLRPKTFIFPVVYDRAKVPSIAIGETQDLNSIQATHIFGPEEKQLIEANRLSAALHGVVPTTGGQDEQPAISESSPGLGDLVGRSFTEVVVMVQRDD